MWIGLCQKEVGLRLMWIVLPMGILVCLARKVFFYNSRGFMNDYFSILLGNVYAFEAELQGAIYAIEMAHRFSWISLWLESDFTFVVNLLSYRSCLLGNFMPGGLCVCLSLTIESCDSFRKEIRWLMLFRSLPLIFLMIFGGLLYWVLMLLFIRRISWAVWLIGLLEFLCLFYFYFLDYGLFLGFFPLFVITFIFVMCFGTLFLGSCFFRCNFSFTRF